MAKLEKENFESLMNEYKNYLKDRQCVRVELFYDNLKKKNDVVAWIEKTDEDTFIKFLEETKDPLEVLAEGYRCLSQIYINLLRDFEIFCKYPIRKYSSAFHYISKIDGFKELLKDIGYVEEDLEFVLKVTKILDEENITKVALKLQICFMEILELFKLHREGFRIMDEISLRKNNIAKEIKSLKVVQMTEEEKIKLFEKCPLCESNINKDGECDTCGATVTDHPSAWEFKDFLKNRFHIDISKIKGLPKNDNHGDEEEVTLTQKNKVYNPREVVRQPEVQKGEEWACNFCTFLNDNDNLNCACCSQKR